MPEPVIRVSNVIQHYGVRPILKKLCLDVMPGELLTIMGPNGSGKTTLLGVIAGLLAPIDGYVEINGVRRRASEDEEIQIRRRVFYLMAEPYFPSYVSSREYLLAVGRLYDVPDLKLMDHVDRLFALFDLEKQADTAISNLSSGQRKKVSLASALVTEAPILLLDEPFSGGLDPAGLMAIKQVLKRLADQEDTTIVMATPVPELVEEVADRVAILIDGQIIACDTVAGLRKLSGCDGPLPAVLEHLIHPGTQQNLAAYFGEKTS